MSWYDYRTAGVDRLENPFNLDVFFLPFKTETDTSFPCVFTGQLSSLGKFQAIFTIMIYFMSESLKRLPLRRSEVLPSLAKTNQ